MLDRIADLAGSQRHIGLHELHRPSGPAWGSYSPSFLWVKGQPGRLALVGEVVTSGYASAAHPGCCVLADHLCSRWPAEPEPLLVFVCPDEARASDLTALETHLGAAAPRLSSVRLLPAMRLGPFLAWFEGHLAQAHKEAFGRG